MGSLNSSTQVRARASVKWFALPIAMLLVSGCSSLNLKDLKSSWSKQELAYDKIAENLVNSLAQLPTFNPGTTAVQVSDTKNTFDVQLKTALIRSGFNVKPANNNDDVPVASSAITKAFTVAGRHNVFSVNIGSVSIARAFAVVDGSTAPVTSQLIIGSQAQAIELNDQLFGTPDRELAPVEFRIPGSDEKVWVVPTFLEEVEPELLAANTNDARKQNFFDIGQSNYGAVFEGYEDVRSSVLIFPNDSLRLGSSNKAIIEQYVGEMNPETDLLSVVGCSIGTTEIADGNSLLAIGRANRVKEAFLFSGMAHDQVLEEGCWSSKFVEMELPARGVVVTLKRQKKL